MEEIKVMNLGNGDYEEISKLMKSLQKKRIEDKISDTMIIVEHEEIVTIGPKARRENVQVSNYPTFETDRGGGITWHGPGQLVIYPIIKWKPEEQSVRKIISRLEDWGISSLKVCGINSYKNDRMQGIWVDGFKIGSIGLSFLKWVSRHGLSINIDTPGMRVEELEGCGLNAGMHTSLKKLGYDRDLSGQKLDFSRLEKAFIDTCKEVLDRNPILENIIQ
jgi:lipoate-protein ligase B